MTPAKPKPDNQKTPNANTKAADAPQTDQGDGETVTCPVCQYQFKSGAPIL